MAFPFIRAALAVLLVSSFVFALSAEDVARFYLKSGETMKLEPIVVSGITYNLVKIDGEPSLVLAPSGSTFEPVVDKDRLLPIVQAYSKNLFQSKDFPKSVKLVNETTPIIEKIVGDCVIGAKQFIKVIPTRSIRLGKANIGLYYLIKSSQTYKSEQDAITSLNQSLPAFSDAYDVFLPNGNQFGATVASGDTDAILSASQALRSSASVLKAQYANVSSSYAALGASRDFNAILLFTFYVQGEVHNCSLNGNATTALSRIENEFSDKSLKSSPQLSETILSFTTARNSTASKDTAYALRQEDAAKTAAALNNLSSQFNIAGYKVELKALIAKKDALNASLLSVKTTGQTTSFDAEIKEINSQLAVYKSSLAPYKTVTAAIKAASENFTIAQKKYGDADSRITALAQELNSLKANVTASMALLSSGDAAKASAQFSAQAVQANDLAGRAGALPAKGNDLDLPVIGGILLLIVVLAGTVWYFRKMKSQTPKMGTD
ncbi:hypothetical protein HY994_00930 [Candidatus Micrarchaeota archaeon]|nr:hypothetical protein [Candidatus Micrarchaeota archaeon]